MGLPLLLFAFGEQVLPAAVILLLVENILHFVIAAVGVRGWPCFIARAKP